jgi:hypothetical protein
MIEYDNYTRCPCCGKMLIIKIGTNDGFAAIKILKIKPESSASNLTH